MIAVTTIVGLGQHFINILRDHWTNQSNRCMDDDTAGIALTFYLTQPELIASWL